RRVLFRSEIHFGEPPRVQDQDVVLTLRRPYRIALLLEQPVERVDVEVDYIAGFRLIALDGRLKAGEPRRLVDDDGDRWLRRLREGKACSGSESRRSETDQGVATGDVQQCHVFLPRITSGRAWHGPTMPTNNKACRCASLRLYQFRRSLEQMRRSSEMVISAAGGSQPSRRVMIPASRSTAISGTCSIAVPCASSILAVEDTVNVSAS